MSFQLPSSACRWKAERYSPLVSRITHVVRLTDIPAFGHPTIEEFRRLIWQPIQAFMREHGLGEEIDLIAYSGDFPYGVDFSQDVRDNELPRNRFRGKVGSLTSLTFFANRAEIGDTGYLGFNHYLRRRLNSASGKRFLEVLTRFLRLSTSTSHSQPSTLNSQHSN